MSAPRARQISLTPAEWCRLTGLAASRTTSRQQVICARMSALSDFPG